MSLSVHRGSKDYLDLTTAHWGADALGLWNPMLSGMQAWNGACGKAAAAVSREWADFLNRRMKEDIALPQRLASCGGLNEAWQMYAEFWQKAMQDYQQEFTELARINGEVVREGMTSLEHSKPTGADNRPSHAARN